MGPKTDLKANLWEKWSTTCNLADFASGHKKVILSPKLFQLIQFGSFNVLKPQSAVGATKGRLDPSGWID